MKYYVKVIGKLEDLKTYLKDILSTEKILFFFFYIM